VLQSARKIRRDLRRLYRADRAPDTHTRGRPMVGVGMWLLIGSGHVAADETDEHRDQQQRTSHCVGHSRRGRWRHGPPVTTRLWAGGAMIYDCSIRCARRARAA